jgi:hypothetical protein
MVNSMQPMPTAITRTLLPDPWFAVAAALIAYVVVLFAPQVLNDGDTYWHISAGNWILSHAAVPTNDPFSGSVGGAPWVAHEWLSEVLMALAFGLAGWSGVVMLTGIAAAVTAALLAGFVARRVDALPAILLTVLGCACVAPSLLARPHVFTLPLLVLWTSGLLAARRRGTAPAPLLLILIPIWANLHGSFIFAIALIAPFALEALQAAGANWRRPTRDWALFGLGATAAALLTPQGLHGLLFPFQLMQLSALAGIAEWKPTNFAHFQPIEAALIAFLYFALSRGVRLPPLRLLLLLGLTHLALQHSRHQMLAGLVGAMLLADPLSGVFPPRPAAGVAPPPRRPIAAIAGLGLAAVFTALRIAFPLERTDGPESPVTAFAHVPAAIAVTPVFNDYAFGGYLIFRGLHPFVDGRADLYGDPFLDAFELARQDPDAFARLVDRYGIRWTMLSAGSSEAAMVDRLPGWRRLYADDTAVIHVRTDARPP